MGKYILVRAPSLQITSADVVWSDGNRFTSNLTMPGRFSCRPRYIARRTVMRYQPGLSLSNIRSECITFLALPRYHPVCRAVCSCDTVELGGPTCPWILYSKSSRHSNNACYKASKYLKITQKSSLTGLLFKPRFTATFWGNCRERSPFKSLLQASCSCAAF